MAVNKCPPILAVLCCLLGPLAAPAFAGAAAPTAEVELDAVIRWDKTPVPQVTITQDNYQQVIGKIGGRGGDYKVPSCFIKEVLYADRDANYGAAVEKRDEGRYALAALYFLRGLEGMTQQKWAKEYCSYGIADSLYQAGFFKGYKGRSGTEYKAPAYYYQQALAANPKTRFIVDILTKVPVCLAEEGKLDEAEAKLKEAEVKLKAYRDETIKIHNGFGEIADRAAAQLAIADARLAERKAADGKAQWNDVKDKWISARSKCSKFPESLAEAVDGLLRTLVADKKFNEAKAEAESIIEKYKREGNPGQLPLLPGAYIVLGKANLAQAMELEGRGASIPARNAYAEARWAFLNVVAQFFDNEDYVVQAHFFAAMCYDKLRDLESDAGDMAVRNWKLIVQNFPKSEFKDKAEKELARVGTSAAAPKAVEPAPAPKVPDQPKTPAPQPKK